MEEESGGGGGGGRERKEEVEGLSEQSLSRLPGCFVRSRGNSRQANRVGILYYNTYTIAMWWVAVTIDLKNVLPTNTISPSRALSLLPYAEKNHPPPPPSGELAEFGLLSAPLELIFLLPCRQNVVFFSLSPQAESSSLTITWK